MGKAHKYSAGGKKKKEGQPEEINEDKLRTTKVKQILGVKKKIVKKKEEELRKAKKKLNKKNPADKQRSKEIRKEIKQLWEDYQKDCKELQADKDAQMST